MDKMEKIIDLGCGKRKVKGSIGVDRVKLPTVDIAHDLTKFPYPFEDGSVDKIYCRHVLEHFDADTRIKALEEIYRMLKVSGQVEIRVPHVFSISAFRDPTHKSFFTFDTMRYFTTGNFFSYYTNIRFVVKRIWANVELFGDWTRPSHQKRFAGIKNAVNTFFSFLINKLLFLSNTIADSAVKMTSLSEVEIVWVLVKVDNNVSDIK